ncbi:MAG: GntR family transcriptional regulator [Planctomycetota bacterium]|jgi:DNA-binding LacI/PurR family transcriptional regulator
MSMQQDAIDKILKWISDQKLPVGSKLPSVETLAGKLKLTVTPVRVALAKLADQEILIRKNGVGTFINDTDKTESILVMVPAIPKNIKEEANYEELLMDNKLLSGIITEAKKRNIRLLYCEVKPSGRFTKKSFNAAYQENPAGVILAVPGTQEMFELLIRKFGLHRIVSVNRSNPEKIFNSIYEDYENAALKIFQTAYDLGHRNYVFAHPESERLKIKYKRDQDVFLEFCRTHNEGIPARKFIFCNTELDTYRESLKFLQQNKNVTCIITVSNMRARGVVKAIEDVNLKVGKDISVISLGGFQEIAEQENLSCLLIDPEETGRKAVELLLKTSREHLTGKIVKVRGSILKNKSLGAVIKGG